MKPVNFRGGRALWICSGMLPLAMLALCLAAGAELEAVLAAALGCMDPGARVLLLVNLTLAVLGLPTLLAASLLLRAGWLRRGGEALPSGFPDQ